MGEKRLRKATVVKTEKMAEVTLAAERQIMDSTRKLIFEAWKIPEEYSDIRRAILTESFTVFRTARNYLDYINAISGKYVLNPEITDLKWDMEKVCDEIRLSTDRRGIKFTQKLPKESILTVVDVDRLNNCVFGVVLNSLLFGKEGNSILLKMVCSEKLIKITIRDKGMGMTDEIREKCFEPFFSSNPGGEKRLGLGLTLARHFAVESGGRLTIKTENGVGTEVTFFIPRVNPEENTAMNPREERTEAIHLSSEIIFSTTK